MDVVQDRFLFAVWIQLFFTCVTWRKEFSSFAVHTFHPSRACEAHRSASCAGRRHLALAHAVFCAEVPSASTSSCSPVPSARFIAAAGAFTTPAGTSDVSSTYRNR